MALKLFGVAIVRERLLSIVDRFDFVAHEPTFGPGRFDTFNPAKALLNWDFASLPARERIGVVDFPSVWMQAPKRGMQLHWDGNNDKVEERNRSLQARLLKPASSGSRATMNQARTLLERRASRVVWTPALNQLRRDLPNDLILERLEARTNESEDAFSGLQLSGRLRVGKNVEPVVECLDRLSASPAYRAYFTKGKLERVDTSQDVARFVITCPLIRPASSDTAGEAGGG